MIQLVRIGDSGRVVFSFVDAQGRQENLLGGESNTTSEPGSSTRSIESAGNNIDGEVASSTPPNDDGDGDNLTERSGEEDSGGDSDDHGYLIIIKEEDIEADVPSEPQLPEGRPPLVAACLNPSTFFWRSDRIDFFLHMFSSYAHGLRVFQNLREDLSREFEGRERTLRSRELRLYNDHHRFVRSCDLEQWEQRLMARENDLARRERELVSQGEKLDEDFMTRLQEFLCEVEEWGLKAPSQEQPPSPHWYVSQDNKGGGGVKGVDGGRWCWK